MKIIILTCSLILAGYFAYAQANPYPCKSSPQHRQFDFWIGEWNVYLPDLKSQVGESKIEIGSDGCLILENWTSKATPPTTGKSMNYINPQTSKWEQLWVGSGINLNNPQKFINGEYKDEAMRFDFTQVDVNGNQQIGRFIFFNLKDKKVRQFCEVSSNAGKTWITQYDYYYIKK